MKLTKDKFQMTVKKIAIGERPKLMAYEVLVNGRTSEDVGKSFSVSRQTVHKSASRVWNSYLESIDCPDGWTSVELMVPLEFEDKFKKIQKDLFSKYLHHKHNV